MQVQRSKYTCIKLKRNMKCTKASKKKYPQRVMHWYVKWVTYVASLYIIRFISPFQSFNKTRHTLHRIQGMSTFLIIQSCHLELLMNFHHFPLSWAHDPILFQVTLIPFIPFIPSQQCITRSLLDVQPFSSRRSGAHQLRKPLFPY